MNCWNSRIPICLVGDEVVPERRSRKFRWHNQRSTGKKRGQETRQQSMNMEERHNQQGPVLGSQIIRIFDVLCTV